MAKVKKSHKVLWIVLACVFAAIAATAVVFGYFGGFGTGPSADPKELSAYAGSIDEISVPEGTRVVALGEATHGNSEFQQLKLDVFKHLVEDYGVRAFALEGDYGCCEQVNRFIHGGNGTTEEAAAAIGFAIYRTDEIEALISYMRDYNESAAEGEDLRFYGFDMQRCLYSFEFLVEACKNLGVDSKELEALVTDRNWSEGFDNADRTEIITNVKNKLLDTENSVQAIHLADMMLQYIQLQEVDPAAYGDLRDKLMAQSIFWIEEQEEALGHEMIFVSAHNGHVGRFGYDNMGKLLNDKLGSSYFVIGTDFYKTTCNMPKGQSGARTKQVFYSYDPLAKAAKEAGLSLCWVDFSKIPESSSLKKYTADYIYMGSLGEGYSILMRILPQSYRIFQSPETLYDGMIFVAEASPTEIK